MSDQIDLSILAWVEAATGAVLLAYLLGCDTVALQTVVSGETPLTEKQAEVINTFSAFRSALPKDLDETGVTNVVRGWVAQLGEDGRSTGRLMHEHVLGAEDPPVGRDDVEDALIALAADAYPAYLLSPDPDHMPMMEPVSFLTSMVIHRHPEAKTFIEAALRDPVLGKIFATETETSGHIASVYRNTGSGGGLQLVMLPSLVLGTTWRHVRDGDHTPERFADQAIKELALVRRVLGGKSAPIVARFAFAGVLLPTGAQLDLGDGIVRAATDADRELAPDVLKGQLQATDAAGQTTFINYDGDVILEYKFPYRVRLTSPVLEDPPPAWPEDMRPPAALEQTAMRLRFSLMLAVERETRVQLVTTWRYFDDPLSSGRSMSWSDPRQGTGIMPTQLTDAEVVAWGEWYQRLSTKHAARIELALTRILRAIAERRELSDVLIDSVIAWENLFGTKEGEPTLRVTVSLAKLLEPAGTARRALRTRLRDIYTLRSDVVHGSVSLKEANYPMCQEALEVAIRAVRVLATERTDILELPSGAERSNTLLLE